MTNLCGITGNEPFLKDLVQSHGPGYAVERLEPLFRGYSHDRKFIVWREKGSRLLLRLSSPEALKRRQAEYDMLKMLNARAIRCPQPVAAGLTPCESYSFSLMEYIEGDDAEQALPSLPVDVQYRMGSEAGIELWRIHQLGAKEPRHAWLDRRIRKYRLRLEQAKNLSLSFHSQDRIERYVEEHLELLEHSTVCLQHDDYHPANMIVRDRVWVGIIDFNRCDQGDPIEEFYKVPWFTIRSSVLFARGQVDGYLQALDFADFWARYNLFVAMNLHGSLVWEYENSPAERQGQWFGFVKEIVDSHDWDGSGPPQWYSDKPSDGPTGSR